MTSLPPGSYQDRPASASLEQNGSFRDPDGVSKSPLIFPDNIGSPGGFNNHFMVIDILQETTVIGGTRPPIGGRPDKRQLMQADQTIVLYMPNTLAFTTQNEYEEVSLTSVGLSLLPGAMGTTIGNTIKETSKLLNSPLNPRTEVLFTNTKVRQFQFDFLFAPSSDKEAATLKKIIFEMRRAAAVKRNEDWSGLLWIPPRKLQIRFFQINSGVASENTAFPKLKPLVIDNLDFDFAPTGTFSTFTTGYPVATRMMLRVREDEVIDRQYIETNDAIVTGPSGPGVFP